MQQNIYFEGSTLKKINKVMINEFKAFHEADIMMVLECFYYQLSMMMLQKGYHSFSKLVQNMYIHKGIL